MVEAPYFFFLEFTLLLLSLFLIGSTPKEVVIARAKLSKVGLPSIIVLCPSLAYMSEKTSFKGGKDSYEELRHVFDQISY